MIDATLLPKTEDCLAHLNLLEAFLQLRCQVHLLTGHTSSESLELSGNAWNAYIETATAKFAQWVSSLNQVSKHTLFSLPTLDVLMVWHAFMLNPVKYAHFEKLTNLPRDGIPWADLHSSRNPTLTLPSPSNDTTPSSSFIITTATNHPATIPFDLAAAVHRQHSFATKMTRYAWHRSPSAQETTHRSITRYSNFFSILKANSSSRSVAVPTLDVDLIWHTHQLNPAAYRSFSRIESPKGEFEFVNHDDTVKEGVLDECFRGTREVYREMYDEEYNICLCWVCGKSAGPEGMVDVETLRLEVGDMIEGEFLRRREVGLMIAPDLAIPRCGECGEHGGRECPEGARKRACGCGKEGCPGCGGNCSNTTTCSSCSNCGGCGG